MRKRSAALSKANTTSTFCDGGIKNSENGTFMGLQKAVTSCGVIRLLFHTVQIVSIFASFSFMGYFIGITLADHTLEQPDESSNKVRDTHAVAGLNCADHGGPYDQHIVDEMVYWSDVPTDASYVSPMHPRNDPNTPDDTERFLTFEPDLAGWNNVRMSFETAVVMSHAMGRTLVIPTEQRMRHEVEGENRNVFGFHDFFHLDAISEEHEGIKIITMEEFLERVGITGNLRHIHSHSVKYPPGNITKFASGNWYNLIPLWTYLRSVGRTPESWDETECVLAIPSSTDPESIIDLENTFNSIMDGSYGKPRPKLDEFIDNPTSVNATMAERMREMLADRKRLCIYDKELQTSKLIHIKSGIWEGEFRLLTHFYAFVFFADWKQDLWSKRFVRDHLRLRDEIMCAAAQVLEALTDRANARENDTAELYDSMHVRRGDFKQQYSWTQLTAEELYSRSEVEFGEGSTLYISTAERDKGFFDLFKKHHDVVFLDDFHHLLSDINKNFLGMIDQLVASKSRAFYGTYRSTFSGYINRLRGYHVTKNNLEGYKNGTMVRLSTRCLLNDLILE